MQLCAKNLLTDKKYLNVGIITSFKDWPKENLNCKAKLRTATIHVYSILIEYLIEYYTQN